MKNWITRNNRINLVFTLLILLWIFHTVNTVIILKYDKMPLFMDAQTYYSGSINLYNALNKGNYEDFKVAYYKLYVNKPPFMLISTVPLYYILGPSKESAILVNSLYLIILLFSVFMIGKELVNPNFGLLSAFIVSFLPGTFAFTRVYYTDFALMSITALCIFLLLKSNNFKIQTPTLLFGIFTAIGVMIKFTSIIYLIGPILITLYYNINKLRKNVIKNIMTSFLLFLFISLPWYVHNFNEVFNNVFGLLNTKINHSDIISTLLTNLCSQTNTILYQINLPLLIAILILFYFIMVIKIKEKNILLSIIMIPLFFSIIFVNKSHTRFNIILLPYFGLILTSFIYDIYLRLKKLLMGNLFLGIIILFFIISFFKLSYNFDKCPWDDCTNFRHSYGLKYIDRNKWNLDELHNSINKNLVPNQTVFFLTVSSVTMDFFDSSFIVNDIIQYNPFPLLIGGYNLDSYNTYPLLLKNSSLIVLDLYVPNYDKYNEKTRKLYTLLYDTFTTIKFNYNVVDIIQYPYNNSLVIYKKNSNV